MATTNIVSSLGAGSGIDIKKLAEDLVAAERAPRQTLIDQRIERTEARISGYGAVRYALSALKDAFAGLNEVGDFATVNASSSQATAVSATATSAAAVGRHTVTVTTLATAQRNTSVAGYATKATSLNGGGSFDLTLSVGGGAAQAITVETDTPEGVVNAINDAGVGLNASLMNVGGASPWRIVVTGQTGATQSFTLTSAAAGLDLSNQVQVAGDASLTVDGLPVTRSTNQIGDLLDGVTLNLSAQTAGPATLDLARDTSGVRAKVDALVAAYNDLEDTLKVLSDPASDVEGFGGALDGDRLVQVVRSEVRRLFTGDSSTPGATVRAVRDVGLSIDREGRMSLDATALEAALQSNYDEVVQMFSAAQASHSVYSPGPAGVAGDAVTKLDQMLRSNATLARQNETAAKEADRYRADLTKLEARMATLLERYTRQFSVMEAIVGNASSLRDSLTGTFEGLMAMYTRK
jgi:flagellar hook-associated protein 2